MADATLNESELLPIGELAALAGTSPRMLRYYEAQGLLDASRTTSGHRRFVPGAETTVRGIRLLLDAGVPTRLIRDLLDCVHDASRVEPCAVPILAEHLNEHDRRLARLTTTRSALQGLIDGAKGTRPLTSRSSRGR